MGHFEWSSVMSLGLQHAIIIIWAPVWWIWGCYENNFGRFWGTGPTQKMSFFARRWPGGARVERVDYEAGELSKSVHVSRVWAVSIPWSG